MDEPAPDRASPNVVVAIVVLLVAVAALVVAGILFAREDATPVSTGGTAPGTSTGSTPGTAGSAGSKGSTPGTAGATCKPGTTVPKPTQEPTDTVTANLHAALVGCTEADATSRAQAAGWTVRVVRRDGEDFAVTMDFNPARLNLSIEKGIVTDVNPG
jgi:hypothetical protein